MNTIQRNTVRFLFIVAVVLVAVCCNVYGQQLPIINYDSSKGLTQQVVWSIFQDSRSYLWFGTSDGLTRWDGENFQNFSLADGLPDLTIRTISEDNENNLWIGTNNGIARFDGREFIDFSETGEEYGTIWAVTKDQSSRLWFGTEKNGVSVWTGHEFITFTTAEGLSSNYVYAVMADTSNHLWIGHRGHGITRCRISTGGDLEDCHNISVDDGLGHNVVRAIAEDENGNIWIGTRGGGLSRWHKGSLTRFGTGDGLASDDIYALRVTSENQLVVGTARNGITVCDLPSVTSCISYGMNNGLPDSAVLALATDRDHAIWVGFSGGATQITSTRIVSFGLGDGLPHNTVYSILPSDDGLVLAGTLDGLAVIDQRQTPAITAWEAEGRLPGHEIWEMAHDPWGEVWLATEGGLCRFSGGACTEVFTAENGLADTDLITLYTANDQSLWIGTVNGASQMKFSPQGRIEDIRNFGLTGADVLTISEDLSGDIWIGTDQGLHRWDGIEISSFRPADGLPGNEVMDIVHTRSGRMYMVITEVGLVEVTLNAENQPDFSEIGTRDEVPNNVSIIMKNTDHSLWLGTEDGIIVYDPESHEVLEKITTSSGLPAREVHELTQDSGESIWVATSVGLTRIDKARTSRKLPPPIVNVDRIRAANGQEWRSRFTPPSVNRDIEARWLDVTAIRLEHDFALLRFDFHALRFGNYDIRFIVFLEGFDKGWSDPGKARFKEYTNLDPGEYSFHVKAGPVQGQCGEAISIPFTVVPAWWQTILARISFGLLLITLLISSVRLRTRSIRNRALQLERAVADRTDDLRRYARAMEEHTQALDQANIRILEADRVKTEFLANMSHELRTPLNSIIGFSEILSQKLKSRIEKKEMNFLRNVSRSGRYLLLLINNLLDLSKIEAEQMEVCVERVELPELVSDTLKIIQGYAADRKITVELTLNPDVGTVEVDIPKFNQILINLLSNAVKFSSTGDTVFVSVRRLAQHVSPIHVDSYELSINDHGRGIPEKDHDIIFDVFQQAGQTSSHPEGTGLGLALVHRFVTLLGGNVCFDSIPGDTTFRVVLPIHLSGAVEALPIEQSATDKYPVIRRPCVLVLDGNRIHFQKLAPRLEAHGLLPVRAEDGKEAFRMNEALRPAALIILWNSESTSHWRTLTDLVSFPNPMPIVVAAHAEGIGEVSLAADACSPCPANSDDFFEFSKTFKPESRLKVLLRCTQRNECAHLDSILDQCGIEYEILQGTQWEEKPDLIVLDLGAKVDPDTLAHVSEFFPHTLISLFVIPSGSLTSISALEKTSEELITTIAHQVRMLVHRRSDRKKT